MGYEEAAINGAMMEPPRSHGGAGMAPTWRRLGVGGTFLWRTRGGLGTPGVTFLRRKRGAGAQHLAARDRRPHALAMFAVSEEDAAAIRAAFERDGEFAAALELRRRFPGITDNAEARTHARTIAGWKPLGMPRRLPGRLSR
jgi:hypothetical protein